MSGSVSAYGTFTVDNATAAGAVAVQVPAASLPRGRYRIDAYAYMTQATTPTLLDALQISIGATAVARLMAFNAVNSSSAFNARAPFTIWADLDGAQAVAITATGPENGASTEKYSCALVVTQVPYGGSQ